MNGRARHLSAVIVVGMALLAASCSSDSGGAGNWTLAGCEGAAGSSLCTFTAGGDPTVVVEVGNDAAAQGQPRAVTGVTVEG